MKILILGGTQFLGRHLTESALKAGHEVTLFNRGKTNPGLFKNVEYLKGDREAGDLEALKGRTWDAVIDTSGYVPRVVRQSAELLADAVAHYTFVSTISVYSDTTLYNLDESGPVGVLEDETREDITGETYGALKVLCEKAAEAAMPGRVLHARSGLIVGPHDPTDRFTYWPVRVAQGGEILAPGGANMRTQFIDARDEADWMLRMAAARKGGVYNLTGPDYTLTMSKLLDTCKTVTGSNATFTWVPDEFLLEHEVGPFSELPLWIPETYNGLQALNINRALADGLTFRPLEDTIRDTLKWNNLRTGADSSIKPRAGMMRDREQTLLQEWKERV